MSAKALSMMGLAASLALCCTFAGAQSTDVPRHLALARELVQNIKSEDNRYVLGEQFISFPGDPFSSRHAMRADCSGFLRAIFSRAGYSTLSRMVYLNDPRMRRTKFAAEDFVLSIETEKGFMRVRDVRDIRPGDLLAHAMLDMEDQKEAGTTGHVFLIDTVAKPIKPKNPVIPRTQQYEIAVIDSNAEHVGADDTRLAGPSKSIKGLGRGTIRLYADANGEVVGWARTFKNTKRFFSYDARFPSDTRPRKAAIGRPLG